MTQQVRTEGYLLKKGENRHNWKRRWFKAIPANQTLEYFDSPEQVRGSCSRNAQRSNRRPCVLQFENAQKGSGVELFGAKVSRSTDSKYPHHFTVEPNDGSGRVYQLRADNGTEMQEWMNGLGQIADGNKVRSLALGAWHPAMTLSPCCLPTLSHR
jgi:hypothetical protein